MQYRLPVRERSSLHVLPAEPHRHPIHDQRRKRQRFGMPPIDPTCVAECFAAAQQRLRQPAVGFESTGPDQKLFVERDELLSSERSIGLGARVGRPCALDSLASNCFLTIACRGLALNLFEAGCNLPLESLHVVVADDPLGNKPRAPYLARRGMSTDLGIHRRLGERRLVSLVVTVPAIPHEIHQKILPELRTIFNAESHHAQACACIFCIHMHDGYFETLRQIARVMSRSRIDGIGGEPDLVVGDDVQRAADPVAVQSRHVESLGDYTFARKRGVPVNAYRYHRDLVPLAIPR